MWRWEHWKHYDMCILKQSSAAETFLQEEKGVGRLEDRLIKFYMRIESGMEKEKNLRIKSRFKRWSESMICVFQGPDLSKYFGSCLQKNSHRAEEICGFLNVGWPCQRKGIEYRGELHDNSTESCRTWVKFKYQIENYTWGWKQNNEQNYEEMRVSETGIGHGYWTPDDRSPLNFEKGI